VRDDFGSPSTPPPHPPDRPFPSPFFQSFFPHSYRGCFVLSLSCSSFFPLCFLQAPLPLFRAFFVQLAVLSSCRIGSVVFVFDIPEHFYLFKVTSTCFASLSLFGISASALPEP